MAWKRGLGVSESYAERSAWQLAALWTLPAGVVLALGYVVTVGAFIVRIWTADAAFLSAVGAAVTGGGVAAFVVGVFGAFFGRVFGPVVGTVIAAVFGVWVSMPIGLGEQTMRRLILTSFDAFAAPATVIPASRVVAVLPVAACLTPWCVVAVSLRVRSADPHGSSRSWSALAAATAVVAASGLVLYGADATVPRRGVAPVCESVAGPQGESRVCVWPENTSMLPTFVKFAPTVLQLRNEAGLPAADLAEPGLIEGAVPIKVFGVRDDYTVARGMLHHLIGPPDCDWVSSAERM